MYIYHRYVGNTVIPSKSLKKKDRKAGKINNRTLFRHTLKYRIPNVLKQYHIEWLFEKIMYCIYF